MENRQQAENASAKSAEQTEKKKEILNARLQQLLYILLFLIVFVNGFEAGGYQASLSTIREFYQLSDTGMGIYASVGLFATMLSPLLFGQLADRKGKKKSICLFLLLQTAGGLAAALVLRASAFLAGIFILGLTTSALQFISIAALADAYPATGPRKIGTITSLYSIGALAAPLIVGWYLAAGISFRLLFALVSVFSLILLILMQPQKEGIREQAEAESSLSEKPEDGGRAFVLPGILLLCAVMLIYVGFENGFAYFIDSFMDRELSYANGKYAISIFWASMIPARIWIGRHAERTKRNLLAAVVLVPVCTVLIASCGNAVLALCLCVALGFASGVIYPSCLALAVKYAGSRTATATGMITTATGIGGFLFTALTGTISEHFGIRTSIYVLAAFFLLAIAAVAGLHRIPAERRNAE